MNHKLFNTLKMAAYTNQGMYPGVHWDMASKQFKRLYALEFVEQYHPYNPAHKVRAVITKLGRAYLEENKNKFNEK